MDIAGVIIGSIALILALFSSAYAAFQLRDAIRFRKPVFVVDHAELFVAEHGGHHYVGSSQVVLNIRGASQPVTLTELEVFLFQPGGRVGLGSSSGKATDIPPIVWTRVELPSLDGLALPPAPLPRRLELEIHLLNPRDCYVVPLWLELSEDASRYRYSDWGRLRRMVWRHRRRLRGRPRQFIRAVSRGRIG